MGIFRQFPYSNFHDMNMDTIIEIMREMQDEWAETETEWANYKDYIDNYFNNLDVSQEVLDAMRIFIASGELNTIIDPVIVRETVAWLNEHITPTTPAIDDTLSIQGAAADAKATGDAINNVINEFEAFYRGYLVKKPTGSIQRYYFNPQAGTRSADSTRCIFMEGISLRGAKLIDLIVGSGYQANYYFYKEDPYTFISQGAAWSTGTTSLIIVPDQADRVMVMARKPDNSAISDSELMNMFNLRLRGAEPDVLPYKEFTEPVYDYAGHYQYAADMPSVNTLNRYTLDVFFEINDFNVIYLRAKTGYRVIANFFDASFTRLGHIGSWVTTPRYFIINNTYPTAKYFKLTISRADNENIDISEIHNYVFLNMEIINQGSNIGKQTLALDETYNFSSSDVAVYDGNILIGDTNKLWINGVEVAAQIGHGNNFMFGVELDGDFPRLYAGGWYTWEHHVFVNKITANSAELINTIEFPDLAAGYINACVDENNSKIYILLERDDPSVGDVIFAECDFTGAVIATHELPFALPIIQGMDFKNGFIFATNGNGTTIPNMIHVFNTSGEQVGCCAVSNATEIEGICIDNENNIYIKFINSLYKIPALTV